MKTVEIIVKGRVQGVGFRYFTSRAADKFGIVGWVRNEPDGSVRMHATGMEDALHAFRSEVRQGPTFGRVDHLEEQVLPPEEIVSFTDFEIRR